MVSMIIFPSLGKAIRDKSLVLYLSFEEGKGDKTEDKSETGVTGSLKNDVKWTKDGKYGNALSFAGADQHVEVPDVPQLDITKEITMEAWIYPLEVQGDSSLYGRRNSANTGADIACNGRREKSKHGFTSVLGMERGISRLLLPKQMNGTMSPGFMMVKRFVNTWTMNSIPNSH